uniref:Selenoprotein T n=1 Tax=Reticulitermes chinensis TaxID=141911 RepID=A0A7D5Y0T8_9NEOP|nr:Selenoprotein T [Reticulitermes chinensis]
MQSSACGYQKAYQNYGNILREAYPEITVEGVHYSPPGYMTFLARTLGFGKLLIIVCIMSGVNIFGSIGCVEPSWWKWCVENKIYSCVLMFYMCNALEGHLLATGAFEIYFNDVPVWSKLETGRMPQPLELVQIIDNHLQFQTKVELKPGFAK